MRAALVVDGPKVSILEGATGLAVQPRYRSWPAPALLRLPCRTASAVWLRARVRILPRYTRKVSLRPSGRVADDVRPGRHAAHNEEHEFLQARILRLPLPEFQRRRRASDQRPATPVCWVQAVPALAPIPAREAPALWRRGRSGTTEVHEVRLTHEAQAALQEPRQPSVPALAADRRRLRPSVR